MKVKETYYVKGRGLITVVDCLLATAELGDILTDGEHEWVLTGAEGQGPPIGITSRRGHECGLLLKSWESAHVTEDTTHPEEGVELTIKKKDLMDREVGRCTLRQLINALHLESEDRKILTDHLRGLGKAIMHLELYIGKPHREVMPAFKELRETFNKIPPKWFHR